MHYVRGVAASVYIYTERSVPVLQNSDHNHIMIGQASEGSWTETTNFLIRGALSAVAGAVIAY